MKGGWKRGEEENVSAIAGNKKQGFIDFVARNCIKMFALLKTCTCASTTKHSRIIFHVVLSRKDAHSAFERRQLRDELIAAPFKLFNSLIKN